MAMRREPALAGMEGIFDSFVKQKISDISAQKKQKRRQGQLQTGMALMTNPDATLEDKQKGFAILGSLGASVPLSAVKEKPDMSAAFKALGAPDYVSTLYEGGFYSAPQALDFTLRLKNAQSKAPLTKSQFDSIPLELLEGTGIDTYEEYTAVTKAKADLKGILAEPTTPEVEVRQGIIDANMQDAEGNLIPYDELSPGRKSALTNAGISPDELAAIYGYDPKAITNARSAIIDEVMRSNVLAKLNFGAMLSQWQAGETKDMPESTVKAFDKYYNRATGDIKEDILLEEADKLRMQALKRMGYAEAENIPARIRGLVLEVQGMTKQQLKKQWDEDVASGRPLKITEKDLNALLEYLPNE